MRVFRLSRIRGKVAYATKAEHDFQRPTRLRPARLRQPRRLAVRRDAVGTAEVLGLRAHRLAGRAPLRPLRRACARRRRRGRSSSRTDVRERRASSPRGCCASASTRASSARRAGARGRRARRAARRAPRRRRAGARRGRAARAARRRRRRRDAASRRGQRETAIRPERFARLVTLASHPHRGRPRAATPARRRRGLRAPADLRRASCARTSTCSTSSTSAAAPTCSTPRSATTGTIEVDPEPYADNFARPARLLPVEAKALVAAIDLIGDHLPEGALTSAREKIVAALGDDPIGAGPAGRHAGAATTPRSRASSRAAIAGRRLLRAGLLQGQRGRVLRADVEPYALINGREGWYVASFDPARDDVRHFRLDRISSAEVLDERFTPRPEVDPAADVDGWPRTGEVDGVADARASGSRPSARAGRARSAASPRSSPTAR